MYLIYLRLQKLKLILEEKNVCEYVYPQSCSKWQSPKTKRVLRRIHKNGFMVNIAGTKKMHFKPLKIWGKNYKTNSQDNADKTRHLTSEMESLEANNKKNHHFVHIYSFWARGPSEEKENLARKQYLYSN